MLTFGMELIFHSHPNKTDFHNKGCALGLILKVRVFGTRKWLFYFHTLARRPLREISGSLSDEDGDVNENGKKAIGLNWQNNNFTRASRF